MVTKTDDLANSWTLYQPPTSLFDIMKNKKEINREFADLFFPFLDNAKPRGMFTYTSIHVKYICW